MERISRAGGGGWTRHEKLGFTRASGGLFLCCPLFVYSSPYLPVAAQLKLKLVVVDATLSLSLSSRREPPQHTVPLSLSLSLSVSPEAATKLLGSALTLLD
jgi:hypothetical protein